MMNPSVNELSDQLRQLNRIGIALSGERDLKSLLDKILFEARRFTRAEAGTLYIRRKDQLFFEVVQNDLVTRLDAAADRQGKTRRIPARSSIPLAKNSLAGYVGVTKEVVNIPDAYAIPADKDYSFNDSFDRASGYRTRSMLLVPMLDGQDSLVGVLQLINARDDGGAEVVPFDARFEELVHSLASQAAVAITNADLMALLKASYLDTITRLAIAAEYRDIDTANHIHRMSRYSAEIAREYGWMADRVEMIQHAAIMHDVGKIGISDSILLKPGKLTDEEYAEMKKHTLIGARILGGSDSEILQLSELIALTHHERWDGKGYPRGLAAESIPIEGRMVALADVFDALTSKRCYKPAYPTERAIEIIRESSGSHFDPALVVALEASLPRILSIKAAYRDREEDEIQAS